MKKIGLIDSGIGGLTLLSELIHNNFDAKYFYISDADNVPYGGKSQEFMHKQMRSMVLKLIKHNIEAIVIACNTATAKTIDKLRSEFDLPFFGIEPYINYLNSGELKDDDKCALILTEATAKSQRFLNLKKEKDPNDLISVKPLNKLALLIEGLNKSSFEKIKSSVDEEIVGLEDFTHLILGCTHYPILKTYLESKLGLVCINPAENIVRYISDSLSLEKTNTLNTKFEYNRNNSDSWTIENINNDKFNFLSR
ncbi:MAG: glutamate racemase [Thermoproteota archaeon]|jgi:glutamate racemase